MAKKMSASDVARLAGIAPGSYSSLENGWYQISLENLFRIIQALKVDVKDVWPRRSNRGKRREVDEEYLDKVIEEAMETRPRLLTLDDIIDSVCEEFEVDKQLLLSKSKWHRLHLPRAVCGLVTSRFPVLDLTSLCRMIGCHVSTMKRWMEDCSALTREDSELGRRIEDLYQSLTQEFPLAS